MPEKIKVSFYIDRDVWEDFKYFVFQKHGKLHGVLGKEIAKALDMYVSSTIEERNRPVIISILREIDRLNKHVSNLIEYNGFIRADLLGEV